MIITSGANKDEQCDVCGYPFDQGDRCWVKESTGETFCSKTCVDIYKQKRKEV
jgi:predicted nucleic acid-binding Zn ribbon protein